MPQSIRSYESQIPRRDFLIGSAACASSLLLNPSLNAQERKKIDGLGQHVKNFFRGVLEFTLDTAPKFIPFAPQADQALSKLTNTWDLLSERWSENDLNSLAYRVGSANQMQAVLLSQSFTRTQDRRQSAPLPRAIFAPPSVTGMAQLLFPLAEKLRGKAEAWMKDQGQKVLKDPRTGKAQVFLSKYILPPLRFFVELNGQKLNGIDLNTFPKLTGYDQLLAAQAASLDPRGLSIDVSKLGTLGKLLLHHHNRSLTGPISPLNSSYALPQFYLTEQGNFVFADWQADKESRYTKSQGSGTLTLSVVPVLDNQDNLESFDKQLSDFIPPDGKKITDPRIWTEESDRRKDLRQFLSELRLSDLQKNEVKYDFVLADFR